MPLVRFEGPAHRLLAFGKTVERGAEETFTEQELRSLLAQPHLRVTVGGRQAPPARDRPSVHGSRRQWAAYAGKRGVTVTPVMTRDDIITAVDAPAESNHTKENL